MTSTNDELSPPPKPRSSPFDYRNTDLVSRLLAATPPYLYNMPMVPHSFFFSEMLRSLVQAKAENNTRTAASSAHQRRSRKRSWMQAHSECYHHKEQPKIEKPDMPPPTTWMTKSEKSPIYQNKPTEMEIGADNKFNINNETIQEPKLLEHDMGLPSFSPDKQDTKTSHIQFPFSSIHSQASTSSDIILPPPPPVWYPPLYPTPYGIDPLHFFIDLRVSGHIYDKKNQKEGGGSLYTTAAAGAAPPTMSPSENRCQDPFKHSRHASAFRVPSSRLARNIPINLSNYSQSRSNEDRDTKDNMGHTKFDVKSLGLEQPCNNTGTNYVLKNIYKIYRDLYGVTYKMDEEELKQEEGREPSETTTDTEANERETEEEKEKRVRDLRALIGLELVVDYMNHAKPGQRGLVLEEGSTDLDSGESTAVDVVALNEEMEDETN